MQNGVEWHSTAPSTMQAGICEAFHGGMRDELLDETLVGDLDHTEPRPLVGSSTTTITARARPSPCLMPRAFASTCTATYHPAAQSRPTSPIDRCSPGPSAPNSFEDSRLGWMRDGAHRAMLQKSSWQPRLAPSEGPPADRLIEALAADISDGKIEPGERLPAYRDLAYRLEIGLGSVTKAFSVLERRGLVETVRGRGTFVAAGRTCRDPSIDLSVNTPPKVLSERILARTMVTIVRKIDPDLLSSYSPPGGYDEHRQVMARWLADLGVSVEIDRLLLCGGAQQALKVAFSVACPPDGVILTEALSYPGAIRLARHAGYRLAPIEMDCEGILPHSLDRALRLHRDQCQGRVLYVTPTMQNPTTSTMSYDRRIEIVRLARKYDILIIEDDVYSISASTDLPALAVLAPERTFYVNSLSKTLCPGLRMGVLVPPAHFVRRAEMICGISSLTAPPLSGAVLTEWLSDGTAKSIREGIENEARRRVALARSVIGAELRTPDYSGFHAWLPMSVDQSEMVRNAVLQAGIVVTPFDAMSVDLNATSGGIRLCLGGPAFSDLSSALNVVAAAMKSSGSGAHLPPVP